MFRMDVSLLLVWLLHIQHGGPFLQSALSRAGAWSRGLSLFVQVNGEPAIPLLLSAHQNVLFCLFLFFFNRESITTGNMFMA